MLKCHEGTLLLLFHFILNVLAKTKFNANNLDRFGRREIFFEKY